ncbi:hypothetical protein [Haloplanus aerogenes]|uniref:Uncharacterized protein n=1 Tax=Haloplanus aerogenes TaxID=660522 RepID=A0A3G8QYK1_9EURY|nr:hypothetical protein [Haloplanus aerogenes]AZH26688.1 hypothetical protein DU502_15465 [Haloplanus aerogenes]
MSTEWEEIASRTIRDNRKVRTPDWFVELFAVDGMDDSVFWNYEKNSKYIVLSDRPLSKSQYQPVTRTLIYNEGGYRKIRPPGDFSEVLLSKFFEGNELFYLLHRDMRGEDNPTSVYLLTRREVLDLLPNGNPDSDLKSKILSTPGLLPSI